MSAADALQFELGAGPCLRAWDTVNTLIAAYGLARIVLSLPSAFKNLRDTTGRPLIPSGSGGPMNVIGVGSVVAAGQIEECRYFGLLDEAGIAFEGVAEALRAPGVDVRLFGKPESFARRRMGVALATAEDIETARERALAAAARVKPVSGK